MRVRVSPIEVSVGAFVLLGVLGLLALYVTSGGYEGLRKSRVEVACTFNRVEGVGVGTPVKMNGLEIGVVKNVRLNSLGRVLIGLSIDRQPLRQDPPGTARRVNWRTRIATPTIGSSSDSGRPGRPWSDWKRTC